MRYLTFQPPGFIAFQPIWAWRLGGLKAGRLESWEEDVGSATWPSSLPAS